jgi:hypothetical protein
LQRKTEALLVASKEVGLEINAEETKYMFMSLHPEYRTSYNTVEKQLMNP